MKTSNKQLIQAIAVAAVFAGVISDGLCQVDIKNGLVAHYPLDGDAKEVANGSLHGTFKGNPTGTTDRNGKKNSALSFDGKDDWIHIPLDPKWKIGSNDFSVSFWVKTKDNYAYLVDARDAGENGFALHFHYEAPGLGFGLGGSGMESGFRTGNNSDIDGEWHHFAGVRDGRKLTLFKDGIRVKSFTTPVLQNIKNVGSAKIGTRSRVLRPGEYLNGSLDEIRLYDRALNIAEVERLYQDGLDTDNDGLVDFIEIKIGTDPNNPDSDGDGLNDFSEVRLHGTDPNKGDSDGDSLSDYDEVVVYRTSPVSRDSDDDGFDDDYEILLKTDPNDGEETPEGRINIYTAVELEFHASKGKRYQVQHSTDLINWVDFGAPVAGEDGVVRQLVSVREMDSVYWRLEYR